MVAMVILLFFLYQFVMCSSDQGHRVKGGECHTTLLKFSIYFQKLVCGAAELGYNYILF